MASIQVRPHQYPMFGDPQGAAFCLVTCSDLVGKFRFTKTPAYSDYLKVTCDPGESFDELLRNGRIPLHSHILVITPGRLFESPLPELVGPKRKLAVMACGSTPTPLDAIEHFLGVIERTDPDAMAGAAEAFFREGESADYLEIVDEEFGTHARFNHLNDSYEWFEQLGHLDWGCQQLVPSGELSVLPLAHGEYSPDKQPDVTGEIALRGYPIVHSGRPSFLLRDQARIHEHLSAMEHSAVVATVESGRIVAVRSADPSADDATAMLRQMFEVDSRFASIWEIGFGINSNHVMYIGNLGMNEVHGANFGSIHWGLGLTPWTQYHMDLVCPGTRVQTNNGVRLIGPPVGERAEVYIASSVGSRPKMRHSAVAACPCAATA
jgi:hypothetical protein